MQHQRIKPKPKSKNQWQKPHRNFHFKCVLDSSKTIYYGCLSPEHYSITTTQLLRSRWCVPSSLYYTLLSLTGTMYNSPNPNPNPKPKGVTAHVTCRSNPDPNPYTIRLMQPMCDALMCLVKEQVRCVGGYTVILNR